MVIIEIKEVIHISSKKEQNYSEHNTPTVNRFVYAPYLTVDSINIVSDFLPKKVLSSRYSTVTVSGKYYGHIYDWNHECFTTNNTTNSDIRATYR